MNQQIIELAKYGILISNDAFGNEDVQKIDDPKEYAETFGLDFIPPELASDDEAKEIYKKLIDTKK